MKPVPEAEFMHWLAEARIGVDPAYKPDWPRNLAFLDAPGERRYWTLQGNPLYILGCLDAATEAVGGGGSLFLWPKFDSWASDRADSEGSESNALWRTVLSPLKASPPGDAIEFAGTERDHLLSILFCSQAFGWSSPDDVFVVPARRDAIVMLDHHEAIWIETRTADRMLSIVANMAARGFELPTTPPDETFAPQPWMKPQSVSPAIQPRRLWSRIFQRRSS